MASPAPDAQLNGMSTPPATAHPTTASPQPPPTQPSQQPPLPNGAPVPLSASLPNTSLQDTGASKRPRDARLIHLILANMGVHSYTERVPLQLLDFAYRYTSSILTDAVMYEPPTSTATSKSSKKKVEADAGGDEGGVSLNALRTAVGARAAGQFASTLGKEFMSEVASERNRIALPRVEREFGVRLPPERYCFTGVGWGVRERWEEEEDEDDDEDMEDGNGFGGPVLESGAGVNGDTDMGGMEGDEEGDNDEFEEAMGMNSSGA